VWLSIFFNHRGNDEALTQLRVRLNIRSSIIQVQ
jgi:hypothetical protein